MAKTDYTNKQVEEWKKKAEKWDKLEESIRGFYFDKDGNELDFDSEDTDGLCGIGEVAATAFGYL